MAEPAAMIRFSCEACGTSLRLPECFRGQRGTCPLCRRTIAIPDANEERAAGRACSSCGTKVRPEDLRGQELEEVFCKACHAGTARRTDSTILREVGLDVPGFRVLRGERQERERTRGDLDDKALECWKTEIFRKAGRIPPSEEPDESDERDPPGP